MSTATDAVVTIVAGKFWGDAGEGTIYLNSAERAEDLRDIAEAAATMLADQVAQAMCAILDSPALRAELEAIPEDWGPEHLYPMKALLGVAGIL